MTPDPKPLPYVYDNVVNFTMGVDSSKAPNLIPMGYSAFAVNATFRRGKPTNRPAFKELVFPEQENLYAFRHGKHQGETIYQNLTDDTGYQLAVRGGWIMKIDLTTFSITILNPSDQNEPTRRHFFCQADKYMIIQNGVDLPFIYDGVTLRRARNRDNNPGVTNVSITHINGIATITTSTPHGLVVGDYVAVDGVLTPTGYQGNYRVREVPSTTTYKIRVTSTLTTPATESGMTYRPMEVPTGLFMEYVMGRLCVVTPDRREMRIGDIIRTTPETFTTESVLWFTEEQFLAESFVFTLPASQGRIRAAAAIPFMGSPTGQGDIAISGDKGFSTLSLAYPRNEWFDRPIQKVALTGVAIASHIGQVGYNGDIIFRDLEYGVRTFRLAEAIFSKTPAQTPISSEMNRIFLADDRDKLQFTSMEVFDNRLLCTVTPVFEERANPVTQISVSGTTATIQYAEEATHEIGDPITLSGTTLPEDTQFTVTAVNSNVSVDVELGTITAQSQDEGGFLQSPRTGAEYYHKGIAVLDYTTLSGAQGAAQVAWDGLWTGINVQTFNKAFISGAPTCIMAVYNDNLHRNELWELTTQQGADVGESTEQIPPAWVELRALSCEKPFSQKKLLGLNLFLTDLRGNVEGQIYYRQDGDTCWTPWTQSNNSTLNFEVCATTESTPNPGETNPAAEGMLRFLPQRRYIRVGQPLRQCDTTTTADSALFFETQLKIEWTGLMVIDKIELMALEQIQEMRGGCR